MLKSVTYLFSLRLLGMLQPDPFSLCLHGADARSRFGKLFCSVSVFFLTAKTKRRQKRAKEKSCILAPGFRALPLIMGGGSHGG